MRRVFQGLDGLDAVMMCHVAVCCYVTEETDKWWTYRGSLTTPPCYESVIFILFKEPIQISEKQVQLDR